MPPTWVLPPTLMAPSCACRSRLPPRSVVASSSRSAASTPSRPRFPFATSVERDEELTEDDVRREQAKVQKHTDEYVAKVEELLKEKEAEVMEI